MIFTSLIATAALHSLPLPVLAPQNTPAQTAEGVEILRRVLTDALDQAFRERKPKEEVTARREV
jgi:hypothetical protein